MKSLAVYLSLVTLLFLPIARAEMNDVLLSDTEVPTWRCNLRGDMSGLGISVFFGGQVIAGRGLVSCRTTDGKHFRKMPVNLRFISAGIGFDFSIIRHVRIMAVGIGITDSPEALIGEFGVGATAGATFINQGIDVNAAVKVERKDGLGFEVGFVGKDAIGLGVRLHGMVFVIEHLKKDTVED